MNEQADHTPNRQGVHRESDGIVTVRDTDLIEHVTPPEGTDVRAVKWADDPAPVLVGEMVVR